MVEQNTWKCPASWVAALITVQIICEKISPWGAAATVFELPDTHGPSRPCAILKLLEFLLLPPPQHLSLIHLNLFLNMLRDMGPILHSSRWITSCASTIYQIPLNSIFFCFVLSFAIYYDLFLKCYSTTRNYFLVFVPIPHRCGTALQTKAHRTHKAASASLFTFYICFGSNFRLPFLQMNLKSLTWIENNPNTLGYHSMAFPFCGSILGELLFVDCHFLVPKSLSSWSLRSYVASSDTLWRFCVIPIPVKYTYSEQTLSGSAKTTTQLMDGQAGIQAHVIGISNLYF